VYVETTSAVSIIHFYSSCKLKNYVCFSMCVGLHPAKFSNFFFELHFFSRLCYYISTPYTEILPLVYLQYNYILHNFRCVCISPNIISPKYPFVIPYLLAFSLLNVYYNLSFLFQMPFQMHVFPLTFLYPPLTRPVSVLCSRPKVLLF
jgi:hypothetical protein